MGIDDQGAVARATTKEIMPSIPHDEAEIMATGEVNSGFDMLFLLGHDHVDAIVAQGAAVRRVRGWPAGVVGEVGPETRAGLLNAVPDVSSASYVCMYNLVGWEYLLPLLVGPVLRGLGALCGVVRVYRSQRSIEGVVA
jgi:hypothetical protein